MIDELQRVIEDNLFEPLNGGFKKKLEDVLQEDVLVLDQNVKKRELYIKTKSKSFVVSF